MLWCVSEANLSTFCQLTFEKKMQFCRDDTVVWLLLLVLCLHEGASMHSGPTLISVSSDRSNVGKENMGAFLIRYFENMVGFIVYLREVECYSEAVRDTVNVPCEIWFELCWPLGCKTLLIMEEVRKLEGLPMMFKTRMTMLHLNSTVSSKKTTVPSIWLHFDNHYNDCTSLADVVVFSSFCRPLQYFSSF